LVLRGLSRERSPIHDLLGHANITMTLDLYSVVHRPERAECDGADEFLH
jgi:hypothetical protein